MSDKALTPKQEMFAQKYVELGNAAEAYRVAYDAENMKPVTVRRKAAELLEHGNVSAHVRALREGARTRHDVTIDTLTAELDELKALARDNGQYSPAVTAVMGKAKLHGLLVEKNEHTGKDGGPIVLATKEQRDAAYRAARDADA